MQALRQRIEAYQQGMDALGIVDTDLDAESNVVSRGQRLAHDLLFFTILLPLALPGLLLLVPLGQLAGLAGTTLAPRKDVIATTKVMAGTLAIVVCTALLVGWVGWTLGPLSACLFLLGLLVSSEATLRVLERGTSMKMLAVSLSQSFFFADHMEKLRLQRTKLQEDVVAAVDRYIPDEMTPLYPQSPSPSPVT